MLIYRLRLTLAIVWSALPQHSCVRKLHPIFDHDHIRALHAVCTRSKELLLLIGCALCTCAELGSGGGIREGRSADSQTRTLLSSLVHRESVWTILLDHTDCENFYTTVPNRVQESKR